MWQSGKKEMAGLGKLNSRPSAHLDWAWGSYGPQLTRTEGFWFLKKCVWEVTKTQSSGKTERTKIWNNMKYAEYRLKCGTVIRHYAYVIFIKLCAGIRHMKASGGFCIYITCISQQKGYQNRGTAERRNKLKYGTTRNTRNILKSAEQ